MAILGRGHALKAVNEWTARVRVVIGARDPVHSEAEPVHGPAPIRVVDHVLVIVGTVAIVVHSEAAVDRIVVVDRRTVNAALIMNHGSVVVVQRGDVVVPLTETLGIFVVIAVVIVVADGRLVAGRDHRVEAELSEVVVDITGAIVRMTPESVDTRGIAVRTVIDDRLAMSERHEVRVAVVTMRRHHQARNHLGHLQVDRQLVRMTHSLNFRTLRAGGLTNMSRNRMI